MSISLRNATLRSTFIFVITVRVRWLLNGDLNLELFDTILCMIPAFTHIVVLISFLDLLHRDLPTLFVQSKGR